MKKREGMGHWDIKEALWAYQIRCKFWDLVVAAGSSGAIL